MATSSLKSQRLKRWILLLASLIAAAIWVRNLLILFPKGPAEIATREDDSIFSARIVRAPVSSSAFDDSSDWIDPFAPPPFKGEVSRPGSTGNKRGVRPSSPPEPPPWKLAGVVWDRNSPAAILASLSGDHRVVVASGDTLGPSRIERIDQQHIWIRYSGRSWKLTLDETDSTDAH